MKSIFILGASRLQIPAIKKAKEKGMYVYVLDYDSSAVGIPYADKFLNISTIDREAVYEAALKFNPDFIITSASDMPVRTVSWVNEKLGKETEISYRGAICATDKVAMRNKMKEAGVPIPEFYEVTSFKEFVNIAVNMNDQFILKPADNAASRGVVLVDKLSNPDYEEIYEYCVKYSHSGVVLVEEYMDGSEVSVEAFSVNGTPHIITITDKLVTKIPFFVELGHTEPSRLSYEVQEKIKEVANSAIKAIGMKNGPTHTEIKITENGPKLVEIAARMGGDFITSKLVPLSTGVDLVDCSFAYLLNEKIDYEHKHDSGAAIRFIQGNNGILKEIKGIERIKRMQKVLEIEIYKKIGSYICKPQSSSDRIGHIITIGNTADEAARVADYALSMIEVVTEEN